MKQAVVWIARTLYFKPLNLLTMNDLLEFRKVKLLPEMLEVELTCEHEPEHPRDYFAYETDDENNDAVSWVIEELEQGNEWVWCAVRVKVWLPQLPELTEDAYLGGCSYRSEDDFKENSGYYQDMINDAMKALEERLNETLGELILLQDN